MYPWVPAAIGAAGSILGGLMGGSQGGNQHVSLERKLGKQQLKDAQQPIRRLTNDAKKAGIHPLYALGASGGGPSTSFISGQGGKSGSALGEGIRHAAQGISKSLEAANLRALDAQAAKDNAEAVKNLSEAKRAEQAVNINQDAVGDLPLVGPLTPGGRRLGAGQAAPARAYEDRYGEGADVFGYLNMIADFRRLQRKEAAQNKRRMGHTNPNKKRTKYVTKEAQKSIMKSRGWGPTLRRLNRWNSKPTINRGRGY